MRRCNLSLCLLLGSCGEPGPPTPGTPVNFDAVCDKANEDKRLMLEGYLDFPESFTFRSSEDVVMLRVRPTVAPAAFVVGASARIGHGPNHVRLPPKSFAKEDLKLTTADGKTIGLPGQTEDLGDHVLSKLDSQGGVQVRAYEHFV